VEKELGILVYGKLNRSQQGMLPMMKTSSRQGCINRNVAGKLREVIVSLHLIVIRPHLHTVTSFTPPVEEKCI